MQMRAYTLEDDMALRRSGEVKGTSDVWVTKIGRQTSDVSHPVITLHSPYPSALNRAWVRAEVQAQVHVCAWLFTRFCMLICAFVSRLESWRIVKRFAQDKRMDKRTFVETTWPTAGQMNEQTDQPTDWQIIQLVKEQMASRMDGKICIWSVGTSRDGRELEFY